MRRGKRQRATLFLWRSGDFTRSRCRQTVALRGLSVAVTFFSWE